MSLMIKTMKSLFNNEINQEISHMEKILIEDFHCLFRHLMHWKIMLILITRLTDDDDHLQMHDDCLD